MTLTPEMAEHERAAVRGNPIYELIRKSVAKGRAYGTQYDFYQWHAVIDQVAERIYAEYRESTKISREEWEKAFAEGRAFRDTDPEDSYASDDLNCPACNGSGHIDDASEWLARAQSQRAVGVEEIEALIDVWKDDAPRYYSDALRALIERAGGGDAT